MPCNKDLANELPDVLSDVWTDWRQYQCLRLNELEDKVAVHPCWLQLTILVTCSLAIIINIISLINTVDKMQPGQVQQQQQRPFNGL